MQLQSDTWSRISLTLSVPRTSQQKFQFITLESRPFTPTDNILITTVMQHQYNEYKEEQRYWCSKYNKYYVSW